MKALLLMLLVSSAHAQDMIYAPDPNGPVLDFTHQRCQESGGDRVVEEDQDGNSEDAGCWGYADTPVITEQPERHSHQIRDRHRVMGFDPVR